MDAQANAKYWDGHHGAAIYAKLAKIIKPEYAAKVAALRGKRWAELDAEQQAMVSVGVKLAVPARDFVDRIERELRDANVA